MSRSQGAQTSGSTGGDNGAVKTGLGDNVHLNGGVAARVVHGASVDLRNRHVGIGQADYSFQSVRRKEKKRIWADIWQKQQVTNGGGRFTDDPKRLGGKREEGYDLLGEVNGGQVPTTITGRSFGWVSIPFQKDV